MGSFDEANPNSRGVKCWERQKWRVLGTYLGSVPGFKPSGLCHQRRGTIPFEHRALELLPTLPLRGEENMGAAPHPTIYRLNRTQYRMETVLLVNIRSEERRVGKECRSRW